VSDATTSPTVVVLASASPRRRDLLSSVGLRPGVEVVIDPADTDESWTPGEAPAEYVRRVALDKAMTVARRHPGSVVLAADTTVDLDGRILAKPADAAEAVSMLEALSGRGHLTHTAVALVGVDGRDVVEVVTTSVRFRELSAGEIAWYVATGEPLDKAGAYAIQGGAAAFVVAVEGSVSNVVGLPLAETVLALRSLGVPVAEIAT
jgi:septum formation protein